MAEPKVLHQWSSPAEDSEFRVVSGPYERFVERRYYQTDGWHEVKGSPGLAREILRLSVELARARAEGRLEGIIDSMHVITLAGGDQEVQTERIKDLRAAAERELAGGERIKKMWGDPSGASELRARLKEEQERVIDLAKQSALLRGMLEEIDRAVPNPLLLSGDPVVAVPRDLVSRIRQALNREEEDTP